MPDPLDPSSDNLESREWLPVPPLTGRQYQEKIARVIHASWANVPGYEPWSDSLDTEAHFLALRIAAEIILLHEQHGRGIFTYDHPSRGLSVSRLSTDITVDFSFAGITLSVTDDPDTLAVVWNYTADDDTPVQNRQLFTTAQVADAIIAYCFGAYKVGDRAYPGSPATPATPATPEPPAELLLTPDMEAPGISMQFAAREESLAQLINRASLENGSNTPDFILAKYMLGALNLFNQASRARERWYGQSLSIGSSGDIEANFEFYLDGYTLKGTDKIGEVEIIDPEGNGLIIKSKALTDFIDRRISPNIYPEN